MLCTVLLNLVAVVNTFIHYHVSLSSDLLFKMFSSLFLNMSALLFQSSMLPRGVSLGSFALTCPQCCSSPGIPTDMTVTSATDKLATCRMDTMFLYMLRRSEATLINL